LFSSRFPSSFFGEPGRPNADCEIRSIVPGCTIAVQDGSSAARPRTRFDPAAIMHSPSNRGVIRAINSDAEGARSDFARATKLNSSLTAAAANLVQLETQEAQTVSFS
jgi:hypothetical protein